MSPPQPQQPTSINPNNNSLKIRLAYQFLHNLNNLNTKRSNPYNTQIHKRSHRVKIAAYYQFLHNLNNLNTKRSNPYNTQIHKRSHRVKIAAYSSMASVVGSRRAWSRAILWKIRNKKRRRSVNGPNPKREYVDSFGVLGQEVKLRKLVPGGEKMDACGLLDETADYIKCLATQVEVMRTLVDLYSTI